MRREHIQIGWKHFRNQFFKVLRNPIFFVLTIVGNTFLLACAAIFYAFEHESNPAIKSFFDGLWWAVVTVTTVGYGDIVPVTLGGRLTAVGLMLTGSVLFLSFIALLASSFIELEFTQLESEVQSLRKDLERMSKENH